MSQALETLRTLFGHSDFREGQQEVIETLLRGESAAAVFPTGAGKSLCYQLPAVLNSGVTLVVSPLLALMKDQVDALTAKGIPAARLDSTLSVEEYSDILSRARRQELKLLYVAPERFQNERFRQSLDGLSISLFAVDEAHCVSEWGHNFRPDYLKLERAVRACGAQTVLALTATATPKVLDDICATFSIEHRVRTPFFRSNLILRAYQVDSSRQKLHQLEKSLGLGATVVYVTHQKSAEDLAQQLAEKGYEARAYHAGMEPEHRAETQEWFLGSQDGIVVATIAFGMGIDKPDIRAVVHFDPPKSMEGYSQEIGRAGRDGKDSVCTFLYYASDRIPLENFIYGDTPTRSALASLLAELFSADDELILNLYDLSQKHDIRPLVLRTLLTYLELDGHLEERTPIYSSYQFKPLLPSKDMLAQLSGEPRDFLAAIFRQAVKKRVWFSIDLEEAAQVLGTTRERVVKALDWSAEQGWLELKASDLRHRYRVLSRPASIPALAATMDARSVGRELGEVARLAQVLALATTSGCLSARLSEHFGERLPDARCGRCNDCTGEARFTSDVPPTREWQLPTLPPELPPETRVAARFLCGVSSPALSKGRWTRNPGFGSLSGVPFQDVLDRLQS